MKNYEDSKCVWGYMTLCDPCFKELSEQKPRDYRHVDTSKEVKGFPLGSCCEKCGSKK